MNPPSATPTHLPTRDVAARLALHPVTLRRWRAAGHGPPWEKHGRNVMYPIDALTLWEARR